jgi:hypothetical protein
MPVAVKPWTWAKELRDHGPKGERCRDFLCVMYTMRTFMNDDGFTFVGMRRLAHDARMHIRTLKSHLDEAIASGWLSCPGGMQPRRKTTYRACVPDSIKLDDRDQELSDYLSTQFGAIEAESGESSRLPPERCPNTSKDYKSVAPMDATDSDDSGQSVAPVTATDPDMAPELSTAITRDACDASPSVALKANSEPNLWHSDTSSVAVGPPICGTPGLPDKLLRSSLEALKKEEGVLASSPPGTRVPPNGQASRAEETPEARITRIRKAMVAFPKDTDHDIARIAHVKPEEVRQERERAAQS